MRSAHLPTEQNGFREKMRDDRIVLTGIGLATPLGNDIGAVARQLFGQTRTLGQGAPRYLRAPLPIPDLPVIMQGDRSGSDVPFREFLQTQALAVCDRALADSGLIIGQHVASNRVGVFVGTSHGANVGFVDYMLSGRSDDEFSMYSASATTKQIVARFGTDGPAQTINTACSSTLVALCSAVEHLADQAIDVAVLCGIDLFSLVSYAGFASLKAIDAGGTRPFTKSRRGLTLGDGMACFVLERASHSDTRTNKRYCQILAAATRTEPYHATRPDPEAKLTSQLIAEVTGETGMVPYVLAHGTGTVANDSSELKAIELAFGPQPNDAKIPVTALKYYFGHTLGSAAAMQLIGAIVAIKHDSIIPNPQMSDPMESETCYFPTESEPLGGRTILLNSFGFGGSLASATVQGFGK